VPGVAGRVANLKQLPLMKTKTIVILVLSACGTLFIAAIASCAGFFFLTFRNMDATLSPTIDELFAAIDNETFAETYDTHTTAELQQTVTREQYAELGLTIKTRLGSLESKSLRQFNVRQINANRYADVVYNATFENGSGTISGRFKKNGDRWLVVSFHVDSPEFQKDLATGKCPHCGEPHTSNARFCPICGKPLTNDQPAAESDDKGAISNR
jgi:zinc-ribbon domain/Protein of unknown function (DUF4019)